MTPRLRRRLLKTEAARNIATMSSGLAVAEIPAAPIALSMKLANEVRDGGLIRLVDAGPNRWPMLELPFKLSRMRDYDLKPISALGAANKTLVRRAS